MRSCFVAQMQLAWNQTELDSKSHEQQPMQIVEALCWHDKLIAVGLKSKFLHPLTGRLCTEPRQLRVPRRLRCKCCLAMSRIPGSGVHHGQAVNQVIGSTLDSWSMRRKRCLKSFGFLLQGCWLDRRVFFLQSHLLCKWQKPQLKVSVGPTCSRDGGAGGYGHHQFSLSLQGWALCGLQLQGEGIKVRMAMDGISVI